MKDAAKTDRYRIHHHNHPVGTILRLNRNIHWPGDIRQQRGATAIITCAEAYTSDSEFAIPTYTIEFEDGQETDGVGADTIGTGRDFSVEER